MATIGSVLITVYAKTDGLRKSLTKAQKTIGSFAKKASKTLKGLSVAIGVGTVAGITTVIATVNKYASEIDRLAKTSSKLGITVEALQKLQYQAELSGIGAEKFNKAFNKMTTVIADASNGLSTAVRAFDKLGLNIDYIKSLSADEQFYAIAEAMKSVGNQTEKLGLAKDIFGAGATGILNTLNSNLQQTSKEFDSLNISITQSAARMVESYQDSKEKLSRIFSGFGLQLTAQLAGPFKILIDWIAKLAIDMGGMDKLANKFASAFISGIESMISAVAGFIKLINRMEIGILMVSRAFLKLDKAFTPIRQEEELNRIQIELYAIDAQIDALTAKNNVIDITINNDVKKKIDELRAGLAGNGINAVAKDATQSQEGLLINSAHSKALSRAANDTIIMAESTKIATNSIDNFANSIASATKAVSPYSATDKPGAYSFSSALSGAKGLNPGLSALSANKSASNAVSGSQQSLGEFNINMQTDAGKISGKLFGEPSFISSLKSFSDRSTNESARMAAQ